MPGPEIIAAIQAIGLPLFSSKSDLRDAFFNVETPEWAWDLMGLPALRSSELGLSGPDRPIFPVFTRLAMGWNHSVVPMQAIHMEAMRRHNVRPGEGWLSRLAPSPILREDGPPTAGMYIDDKFAIGRRRAGVQALQERMDNAAEAEKLPGKPSKTVKATEEPVALLGHQLWGSSGLYAPPADDVFDVINAGHSLVDGRGVIECKLVEWWMGHSVWKQLLRRASFSVGHTVYKWINKHRGGRARLWASAKEEVRVMCGLLPLCFAELARGVLPFVGAQDAEGPSERDHGGWGCMVCVASEEEVREELRWAEKRGAYVRLGPRPPKRRQPGPRGAPLREQDKIEN